MSMYGPQGGPYPGQPQDPWQGGPAYDPYGAPADPYHAGQQGGYQGGYDGGHQGGYQDQWGGVQSSAPPDAYAPGYSYPPGEMWGPPQQPRRGNSGLIIGVVVVLVLVVLGAGGVGVYVLTRDNGTNPTVGPSTGPSAPASAGPQSTAPPSSASTAPPSAPPSSAAAGPNADARTAKAGDCLVNRGTDNSPDMRKVRCAANTYLVLKRFDGTADKTKCEGLANLTDWYFYDHTDDSQDFVLCLRKR